MVAKAEAAAEVLSVAYHYLKKATTVAYELQMMHRSFGERRKDG